MCLKFDVIGLGEMHGDTANILTTLRMATNTHDPYISHVVDATGKVRKDSGGIVVLVRRAIIGPSGRTPYAQEIVPGRIVKLILVKENPKTQKNNVISPNHKNEQPQAQEQQEGRESALGDEGSSDSDFASDATSPSSS